MHGDDDDTAELVLQLEVAATLAGLDESDAAECSYNVTPGDGPLWTHTATSSGTMIGGSETSAPSSSSKYSSSASTRLARASSNVSP